MHEKHILHKDTRLYTLFHENEGKETVILLHGGPGVPEDLNPLIEVLCREYQVIYFHQRGTLKSPCVSNDFSMERYVDDLDRIASFFGLRKFHLFGHSWGGLYAGIYAAQRQDRLLSLFLCSPASGTGKQWAKMSLEVNRYHRKRSNLTEWLNMQKNALLGLLGMQRSFRNFYKQFAINCNKNFEVEKTAPLLLDHMKRSAGVKTAKAILRYPLLPPYIRPGFRVSVTYGDQDIYGSSKEYVRKRYPTASFHTLNNCGHMHWLHNPTHFYEVFRDHYKLLL